MTMRSRPAPPHRALPPFQRLILAEPGIPVRAIYQSYSAPRRLWCIIASARFAGGFANPTLRRRRVGRHHRVVRYRRTAGRSTRRLSPPLSRHRRAARAPKREVESSPLSRWVVGLAALHQAPHGSPQGGVETLPCMRWIVTAQAAPWAPLTKRHQAQKDIIASRGGVLSLTRRQVTVTALMRIAAQAGSGRCR
jgi:hypothetical protein